MNTLERILENGSYLIKYDHTEIGSIMPSEETFLSQLRGMIWYYYFDADFYHNYCDEHRKPYLHREFRKYVEKKLNNLEEFIQDNFVETYDRGDIVLTSTLDWDETQKIAQNIRINQLTYTLTV